MISVRLACVRHAASVHPEPGSNSLKFVSYPPKRLQSISELVLLYLTKKLSFPGITFLRLLRRESQGSLFLSLFNFQGTRHLLFSDVPALPRRPVSQVLDYITTLSLFCQHLFSTFLSFFLTSLTLIRAFRVEYTR